VTETARQYEGMDTLPQDDLPPMAQAVALALRDWCHKEHGLIYGRHYVGHFLDLLAAEGYTVEPIAVASARSYTTLETLQIDRRPPDDDVLTEGLIKAEDPTWKPPHDPDAPARSLG
jgi:hypothetical protein